MTQWVCIRSEAWLWTVGYYNPDGGWEPFSDHPTQKEAEEKVHYLNGGDSVHSEDKEASHDP